MNAVAENNPIAVTGVSGLGGVLMLFGLLYLLSFVQRERPPTNELESLDIRSVQIQSPENESEEAVHSSSSQPSSLPKLPTPVRTIPSRTIEPMPLNLQVDVSQVLKERDTLEYLMEQRDLFGAFGSVRLEGVDSAPKTIYIPGNVFPKSLKEQGIFSGDVLLLIEISEQGVGRVRRVIEADYPELIDPVVESVHAAIYSRPKRHGKPTRTIIKSVIHFRSGPDGDNLTQEVQE
ncbi:MAG: hypothetical protein O3C43_05845 [Verrucomicrobia bacterium]|nr:hypothetical protein [Verrucomicrobiota bacterium]MDA1066007.1 hypothetical protein [Verrucomicrobiota bacterium]